MGPNEHHRCRPSRRSNCVCGLQDKRREVRGRLNEACRRPPSVFIIRAVNGGCGLVRAPRVGQLRIGIGRVRGAQQVQVSAAPRKGSLACPRAGGNGLHWVRETRIAQRAVPYWPTGRGHPSMSRTWCYSSIPPTAVTTRKSKQNRVHAGVISSIRSQVVSIWLH